MLSEQDVQQRLEEVRAVRGFFQNQIRPEPRLCGISVFEREEQALETCEELMRSLDTYGKASDAE